jgi:hypothetical protein
VLIEIETGRVRDGEPETVWEWASGPAVHIDPNCRLFPVDEAEGSTDDASPCKAGKAGLLTELANPSIF